jgi:hypothetical protein
MATVVPDEPFNSAGLDGPAAALAGYRDRLQAAVETLGNAGSRYHLIDGDNAAMWAINC